MADLYAVLAIVVVVGLALFYIIKSKKKGCKCIGCPEGSTCPSRKNGNSCDCNK